MWDRGGRGSGPRYASTCWPGLKLVENEPTPAALLHVLQSGRVCPPSMLEAGVDPDDAWRKNEPLPIKRGPLLFDFRSLRKPELVPRADGGAEPEPAAGSKRKAADEPNGH